MKLEEERESVGGERVGGSGNFSSLFSGPRSALEDLCCLCCITKERPTQGLDGCHRSTSVSPSWATLLQPCLRRSVTPIWMIPPGRLLPLVAVVLGGFPVLVGHARGVPGLKSWDGPPAPICICSQEPYDEKWEAADSLYLSRTWFIPQFGPVGKPAEEELSSKWVRFRMTSRMWYPIQN